MSQQSNPIQSSGYGSHEERLAALSHDVRGCLHVLETGVTLLKHSREQEGRFTELCELMENEQRKTRDLVNELLELACGR
jgi:signal transduction histidine kinase